jgi:uncharacterized membrane protein
MDDTLFLVSMAGLLPTLLAAGLALPFWGRRRIIAGNVAGSVLILLAITVLIWYRYGTLLAAQSQCIGNCYADMQSLYTPFLLLVVMGWVDVFLLLILSGFVEDHLKRKRRINKEWL